MPTREYEHVEQAKAEALRLGASTEVERRSKHIVLILTMNGQHRKVFLSCSPRDNKIAHVVREDVRRKVREMECKK